MLSPTSLAGLSISIGSAWARPVRAVSPTPATSPGSPQQQPSPLAPLPLNGVQPGGDQPSRNLPRGSLLDLSV